MSSCSLRVWVEMELKCVVKPSDFFKAFPGKPIKRKRCQHGWTIALFFSNCHTPVLTPWMVHGKVSWNGCFAACVTWELQRCPGCNYYCSSI